MTIHSYVGFKTCNSRIHLRVKVPIGYWRMGKIACGWSSKGFIDIKRSYINLLLRNVGLTIYTYLSYREATQQQKKHTNKTICTLVNIYLLYCTAY